MDILLSDIQIHGIVEVTFRWAACCGRRALASFIDFKTDIRYLDVGIVVLTMIFIEGDVPPVHVTDSQCLFNDFSKGSRPSCSSFSKQFYTRTTSQRAITFHDDMKGHMLLQRYCAGYLRPLRPQRARHQPWHCAHQIWPEARRD